MAEMLESESLWEIIAQIRDAAPRATNDADSYEIVDAIFERWLPAHDAKVRADALKEAGNELPGWMPGRQRVSDWLWSRAASISEM